MYLGRPGEIMVDLVTQTPVEEIKDVRWRIDNCCQMEVNAEDKK